MFIYEVCLELHSHFGKTDALAHMINLSLHFDNNNNKHSHTPTNHSDDESNNRVSSSGSNESAAGEIYHSPDPTLEMAKFLLLKVLNPSICLFGVLGNLFSVLVLTRRRMKATMDCTMEQAAHASLIALAVSDMGFCATTGVVSAFVQSKTVYDRPSLDLYVRILAPGIQNTFLHTSNWLTVIMAAGRYAAICRPLQARHFVGVRVTTAAIVATFLFWIVLELPSYWTFTVHEIACEPGGHRYYVLDHGSFVLDFRVKTAFSYVWAVAGFFCPFLLLAYCNIYLIRALRESTRMRQFYRVSPRTATYGSRITPTMVAIVCMFLVLVTPSEVLQFYYYTVNHRAVEHFNVAIVLTNVLQTANFAFSFVLYCVVNVHFWQTWKGLVFCVLRRDWPGLGRRRRGGGGGGGGRRNSTNSNIVVKGSFIVQSTIETII